MPSPSSSNAPQRTKNEECSLRSDPSAVVSHSPTLAVPLDVEEPRTAEDMEWKEDLQGGNPAGVVVQKPSSKIKVKVVEADNGFDQTKEQFENALEAQARLHPRYREWLQREDFLKKTLGVATLAKTRSTVADDDSGDDNDGEIRLDRVEIQQRMKPLVDEESGRVLAVETPEGYRLTVDERELLDLSDDQDEEKGGEGALASSMFPGFSGLDGGAAAAAALIPRLVEEDFIAEEEEVDEDDEELDDEEEEERMDALVTVAVVQRLVECFQDTEHFDQLEPPLQEASQSFLAQVLPLLEKRDALLKHMQEDGYASKALCTSATNTTSGRAIGGGEIKDDSARIDPNSGPTPETITEAAALPQTSDSHPKEAETEKEEEEGSTNNNNNTHDEEGQQRVPYHYPTLEEMLEWSLDDDKVFAKAVDYPLRRIMRVYKMVRRPPREPNIVIDGVEMDF